MIPAFNHSHVLPPFEGDRLSSARSSPYPVTASALVQRMAGNRERCAILAGLFRYRAALRVLGFTRGFQWLDGSFVEDVEAREDRPPNDIDVVTFAHPPDGMLKEQVQQLLDDHPDLFDHDRCKAGFHFDRQSDNPAGVAGHADPLLVRFVFASSRRCLVEGDASAALGIR